MPTQDRHGPKGNNPPSLAEILKDKHKPIFDKGASWLRRAKNANLTPATEAEAAKLEELFGEARDIANDADRIREKEKEPHLVAGREIDTLFNGEIRDKLGTDPKKGGLARQMLEAAGAYRLRVQREEAARAAKEAEKAAKEAERLAQQAQAQEERGNVKQADQTAARADAAAEEASRLQAQAAADPNEVRARTSSGRSVGLNVKLVCTGVVRAELDVATILPYLDQDALVKAVQRGLDMKAFTSLKGAAIEERAASRVR